MQPLKPSVVLAAYAESLLDGRRAIVFGNCLSALGEHLLDRGARVVHFYDEDPGRVAEATARNRSRNITFAPLGEADTAVRDGAFDVAIVEDLSDFAEPQSLVQRARRALSPRGAALVACPNPEGRTEQRRDGPKRPASLSYYDLYDAVSSQFDHVRMLGQTPFSGFAVVDFSHEGEPEVSVDTGFVPTGAEEPEWFVALASERVLELDSYAIVQLPTAELPEDEDRPPGELVARSAADEQELGALRGRVAELETEVAALRASAARQAEVKVSALSTQRAADLSRLQEVEKQLSAASAQSAALQTENERLISENAALTARLEQLSRDQEARASTHEAAAARSATLSTENAALSTENAALSSENAALSSENAALSSENAALSSENTALRDELARLSDRIQELSVLDEGARAEDLQKTEASLQERAAEVRRLQTELKEAHRLALELVDERRRTEPVASDASVSAVFQENARLSADLAAARWTIEELEARLHRAAAAPAGIGSGASLLR